MKKKVTSTDIAHAAGVSQSTVSMILNKKYDVSFAKDTVERVENAAKELGYVPPKRKTRKGTKREKLLVVFCPNLTNPYYVMLLQGIEAHAKEKGFGLFVCNTQRDLRMEERYLKMMWQLRPLGIIYTCNPSHCFMELVGEIAEQIPVAIVNNQNEKMNVDAVELDNSKLGRVMAKHLLELGHRKVAYIAPPLTARQKQRSKRVEGFLKEYEKVGLRDQVIIKAAKEEIDLDVAHIDSEYKIGYELTKELLKETTDVTAIVGLNDMIAFGIMDALQEEKYKNVVLDTHQYLMMAEMDNCEQTVEGYVKYIKEVYQKDIQEMEEYFPVICGEWCLFNSLACGWDTKGGQSVLNGLEGDVESAVSAEEKKKIYQAVAEAQLEAWNTGSGYFYWSYKLLTDTINDKGWIGWDSWDLGRCVDFGWFPRV